MKYWLFLGAFNGLLAVAAGAYGWHGLEATSGGREMFKMGVDYHLGHALVLFVIAWLSTCTQGVAAILVRIAGGAFIAGIILFCGALYTIGLFGYQPIPGTAPAGGFSLMMGWGALMIVAIKLPRNNQRNV
jgi:uncharacterized membrane protein YgdD (TMEM256/DUF423 family)